MNRKKINALMIIGILFLYGVSMCTTFSSTTAVEGGNFTKVGSILEDYFFSAREDYEDSTPQDFVNNFVHDTTIDYPYALMVYDRKGNVAARSGTMITIDNDNVTEDEDEYETHYNVEEYFTDDIKKQIVDFSRNYHSFTTGYKLTYKENGENMIPVDFTIGSADLSVDGDEKITLHLSDEKANKVIAAEEPHYITFKLYGVGENKIDQKIYERLNDDYALDGATLGNIAHMGEFNQGGGGTLSDARLDLHEVIKFSDDYYYAELKMEHNIYYDTLKKHFIGTAVSLSFVFILAGAVLIIAINKMITKNEKINSAKEAFTGAAAHELKTPIAIIQNQCECYMENIAPEKKLSYVESIYEESKRMNKLVLSLLQYNRVAMATNVKKEKTSLTEIVNEEIKKYAPLINAKGIILSTDITPNVIITANREMIGLVIDNYLSNAIKHGDGKEIAITLNGSGFFVFNTGSRIEVQNKKDLWDVFYRSDASRTRKGGTSTGLGLAISKQILLLHKYQYGYSNKPNGVEFYFSIH